MLSERATLNNPTRQCGDRTDRNKKACRRHALFTKGYKTHRHIMSYIQSLYHIVFRTYCVEHTINVENERELYAVILKQSESLSVKLLRIGGMPDHLHLFVSLPATMSVSQYVQNVKAFSSK